MNNPHPHMSERDRITAMRILHHASAYLLDRCEFRAVAIMQRAFTEVFHDVPDVSNCTPCARIREALAVRP